MENTPQIEENHRSPHNNLRMQSYFTSFPHVLAALRVALNLLAAPTVLAEEPLNQVSTSQNRLTIYSITSDVYNLTPGTSQKGMACKQVMEGKIYREKITF